MKKQSTIEDILARFICDHKLSSEWDRKCDSGVTFDVNDCPASAIKEAHAYFESRGLYVKLDDSLNRTTMYVTHINHPPWENGEFQPLRKC